MGRHKSTDHAFVIADINGRYNHILRREDYAALSQCRTFEELIIKLNHHFPFINEDMAFTVSALRSKLYGNIMYELGEFRNIELLNYFVELNKIQTFFVTLETGEEPLLAGAAEEFKGLAACKSFKDARKLYIQGTYLEKYFSSVEVKERVEENDLQEVMLRVVKNCLDYHYYNVEDGYIREIMDAEGDRQMLEICMNGRRLQNRPHYFPVAGSISGSMRGRLAACESREELVGLVCPGAADPHTEALVRVAQVYAEAFKQYGDLSCLYAYFRLKEQEMNNILWISECILQGDYDTIGDLISFN